MSICKSDAKGLQPLLDQPLNVLAEGAAVTLRILFDGVQVMAA